MKEYKIKLDESDLICLEVGDIDIIDSVIVKIIEQGEQQRYEIPDGYQI